MHGRLKVKTSVEKEREKAVERKKKLQAFQTFTATALKDRAEGRLDEGLLQRTRDILLGNPDFYTLWNIRREVLLSLKQLNMEATEGVFQRELEFVAECLKTNPKSYGAWQQRCFVQTQMERPDWRQELQLCSQFLQADDRNFHCWDYRRFSADQGGIPPTQELLFTTQKLNSDFSNFSSWHYRGSLLEKMFEKQGGELPTQMLENELRLVENALFTDPNDQSAWFYHGWLLSDKAERIELEGVMEDQVSILLLFNRPVKLHKDIRIGGHPTLQWTGLHRSSFNAIFVADYVLGETQLPGNDDNITTDISNNNKSNNTNNNVDNSNNTNNVDKKLCEEIELEIEGDRISGQRIRRRVKVGGGGRLISFTDHNLLFRGGARETEHTSLLNNHLQSLQQLQALEPHNKWVIMAISKLVRLLDRPDTQVMRWLECLSEQDVHRKCYYEDMVGKLKIDRKLKNLAMNREEEQQTEKQRTNSIDLSDLNLATLHHTNHLSIFEVIDLSNNQLSSFINAPHWIFLVRLMASCNRIRSCQGMRGWRRLQFLDVSHNDLKELGELEDLKGLENLKELHLTGNPVVEACSAEEIRDFLPHAINICTGK